MERGKIISIDGNDGVGKETQSRLLQERLTEIGIKSKVVSFPNYKSEGSIFVRKYLLGEYGNFDDISPKQTAMFYALDRFNWFKEHPEFDVDIDNGVWYIFDRYVDSNIMYQGSKAVYNYLKKNNIDIDNYITKTGCHFENLNEALRRFNNIAKYIAKLEYKTLAIPKADMPIFLRLPRTSAKKLMVNRNNKITDNKDKDCHESNTKYLDLVNDMELSTTPDIYSNKFIIINCDDANGEILSKKYISDKIIERISLMIKI